MEPSGVRNDRKPVTVPSNTTPTGLVFTLAVNPVFACITAKPAARIKKRVRRFPCIEGILHKNQTQANHQKRSLF